MSDVVSIRNSVQKINRYENRPNLCQCSEYYGHINCRRVQNALSSNRLHFCPKICSLSDQFKCNDNDTQQSVLNICYSRGGILAHDLCDNFNRALQRAPPRPYYPIPFSTSWRVLLACRNDLFHTLKFSSPRNTILPSKGVTF